MAEKLKRRGVAAAIAAVVMIVTLFASGGGKLRALRNEAENVFFSGAAGDGLSIYGDLNTRLESAYNIGIVARRSGMEDSAQLASMQSAYETLATALNEKAPKGSLAALNRELSNAVEGLYRGMETAALTETDEALVAKQYRAFLSANDTISHDGYNGRAAEFNQTLSGFPASVIAGLIGVRPLEYFR